MPARCSFDYAIVRVVPHVEREEFINAGVILFCHDREFLAARIELDEARLLALVPGRGSALVAAAPGGHPADLRGRPGRGPDRQLPLRERWHWLSAPRSTILQVSAPHTGLCEAPEQELEQLYQRMVRLPLRAVVG